MSRFVYSFLSSVAFHCSTSKFIVANTSMPPNLDSPTGTLQPSSDTPLPLQQIEESLRRLKQNTLKIEKRNKATIRTLKKDSFHPMGDLEAEVVAKPRTSRAPSSQAGPSKPPRNPRFLPEVASIIRQSEAMRQALQEECQRNKDHLERMRAEGDKIANSLQSTTQRSPKDMPVAKPRSGNPYKNAFDLLIGLKSTVSKAVGKLSYTTDSGSNVTLKTQTPISSSSNTKDESNKENIEEPEDFVLVKCPAELDEHEPLFGHSTPKPKPRTSKVTKVAPAVTGCLQTCSNPPPKAKRPLDPPPPVPLEQVTIDTLKKMYQYVTEDESTLSLRLPPVPKPRPTLTDMALKHGHEDRPTSSLDESSSEFEYIASPLHENIMDVTNDSDESLCTTGRSVGFLKNPKMSKVEKPAGLRKTPQVEYKKRDLEKRPLSPAVVVAVPSSITKKNYPSLPSIAAEDDDVGPLSELETLQVPITPRQKTPPPLVRSVRSVHTNFVNELQIKSPEKNNENFRSALIPGRMICPLQIQIRPWVSPKTAYSIYTCPSIPDINLLEDFSVRQRHDTISSDDPDESIEVVEGAITRSFAFLTYHDSEELPCAFNTAEVSVFEVDRKLAQNPQVETDSLQEVWRISVDQVDEQEVILRNGPTVIRSLKSEATESNDVEVEPDLNDRWPSHDGDRDNNDDNAPPPLPASKPPPPVSGLLLLPVPEQNEKMDEIKSSAPPHQPETQSFCPPPPPPMPEIPIFMTMGKNRQILPVTPLDEANCHHTIFDTLNSSFMDDKLQFDLMCIGDKFNGSLSTSDASASQSVLRSPSSSDTLRLKSSVSLLSQKRRNAVAICTKRLNHLPTEKIVQGLNAMDTKMFTADEIQVLMQVLPKDDEQSIYETVDFERFTALSKEDHFIKKLSEIPRCSKKLEALNYILGFDETIRTLEMDIGILEAAAESVKASKKFPKILEVVLMIVNTAFVKTMEPVKAFEIQSLQRLASKRSADGKETLLNHLVKCVEAKHPDAVSFYNDFKSIEAASRISKTDCETLIKETEQGLQSVRDEIENMQFNEKSLESVDGISAVLDFVINATKILTAVIRRWSSAVRLITDLMGYLGVPSRLDMDIKSFFGMILSFVNDFKKASSQNEKLFPTLQKFNKENSTAADSSIALRRTHRLSLQPEDIAAMRGTQKRSASFRRQSLGNFSTSSHSVLKQMQEESGQPVEFIDAIKIFGQESDIGEDDRSRIRRRASLYTPQPFRKRNHLSTGAEINGNRER